MAERQQRKANEAAEKFAESLTEARGPGAQCAAYPGVLFNGVINKVQAESNRALADDLIAQQRKQQEASQALIQESVDAYMDFLNSVFAFPRQGMQTALPTTREAREEPPPGEERLGGGRRSVRLTRRAT